jgi:Myosin-crossreactive antigen
MRLYADSPAVVSVNWFKVPDQWKPLPYYTLFASANWNYDKTATWKGVGEVKGAERTWRRWDIPGNVVCGGDPFGTEEQYASGAHKGDPRIGTGNCNYFLGISVSAVDPIKLLCSIERAPQPTGGRLTYRASSALGPSPPASPANLTYGASSEVGPPPPPASPANLTYGASSVMGPGPPTGAGLIYGASYS